MKYFVFSDIHGCIKELLLSLKQNGFDENNTDHHLLFLGDAFDKNRDDYQTYLFLKEMVNKGKCTWVIGNHDVYLLNCLEKGEVNSFCKNTIANIAKGLNPNSANYIETLRQEGIDKLLKSCPNYFETTHYIFTHGMIPFDEKENKYNSRWRYSVWRSWNHFRNINGMKCVLNGIKDDNKTIVCGHIGSYYGNITLLNKEIKRDSDEFIKFGSKVKSHAKKYTKYFEIFKGDGVIGVDCRCFDTGIVNILIVEEQI